MDKYYKQRETESERNRMIVWMEYYDSSPTTMKNLPNWIPSATGDEGTEASRPVTWRARLKQIKEQTLPGIVSQRKDRRTFTTNDKQILL